jgi:Ankyrin repeat
VCYTGYMYCSMCVTQDTCTAMCVLHRIHVLQCVCYTGYMYCNVCVTQDGRTALHYAATFAKEDMVKLLLNRKADPNVCGGVRYKHLIHNSYNRRLGITAPSCHL